MYTKVKLAGHPVHVMLVAFPIVFYTMTFVAFAVYQFYNRDVFWYNMAYFCNFAGLGTAVLAAIPGFIDWAVGIPRHSAAKSRGLVHMTLNISALLLFSWSGFLVYGTWNAPVGDVMIPMVIALLGFVLTMAAGYHGWSMVSVHKLGVAMTPEQERLEPVELMDRRSHEMPSPRPI